MLQRRAIRPRALLRDPADRASQQGFERPLQVTRCRAQALQPRQPQLYEIGALHLQRPATAAVGPAEGLQLQASHGAREERRQRRRRHAVGRPQPVQLARGPRLRVQVGQVPVAGRSHAEHRRRLLLDGRPHATAAHARQLRQPVSHRPDTLGAQQHRIGRRHEPAGRLAVERDAVLAARRLHDRPQAGRIDPVGRRAIEEAVVAGDQVRPDAADRPQRDAPRQQRRRGRGAEQRSAPLRRLAQDRARDRPWRPADLAQQDGAVVAPSHDDDQRVDVGARERALRRALDQLAEPGIEEVPAERRTVDRIEPRAGGHEGQHAALTQQRDTEHQERGRQVGAP